jgi:hypothetical protein
MNLAVETSGRRWSMSLDASLLWFILGRRSSGKHLIERMRFLHKLLLILLRASAIF